MDLVVVGAGIVGLAHAWHAVERGLSVAVVERDSHCVGASVRNFGHGCFTAQSGVAFSYAMAARESWLKLASEAGFWVREAGTVVLARHEDEVEVLREFASVRDVELLNDPSRGLFNDSTFRSFNNAAGVGAGSSAGGVGGVGGGRADSGRVGSGGVGGDGAGNGGAGTSNGGEDGLGDFGSGVGCSGRVDSSNDGLGDAGSGGGVGDANGIAGVDNGVGREVIVGPGSVAGLGVGGIGVGGVASGVDVGRDLAVGDLTGSDLTGGNPAGTTPTDTTSSSTNPTDINRSGTNLAGTPAAITPSDTTPASTTPADAKPNGTTPSGTTPSDITPAGTNPAGTTPSGTKPSGTTPAGGAGGGAPATTAATGSLNNPAIPRSNIPNVGLLNNPSIRAAALLPLDIRVNPREAVHAIAAHLASRGVQFHWSTNVLTVEPGRVRTARGEITCRATVVAVGHDVDRFFPDLAEKHEVQRCQLRMLRVAHDGMIDPAVLTGFSMLRYDAFAQCPSTEHVKARLTNDHPELVEAGLNLMFTQLPDGSLTIGDTHHYSRTVDPYRPEDLDDLVLAETARLLGVPRLHVLERWRGIYASAPEPFLTATPTPATRVVSVTSGIGMTTALGLAPAVLDDLLQEM
ncbi:FAD-dependent oxidoreductase [Lentzea sp. CA-135723]|uniref:FAD-dependent oxidoreductase n=1 Tax=Lentzea sp. CA-135723 TaxID=3239950 RepID=UPI003D8AB427